MQTAVGGPRRRLDDGRITPQADDVAHAFQLGPGEFRTFELERSGGPLMMNAKGIHSRLEKETGPSLASRDSVVFEAFADDNAFAESLTQGTGTVTMDTSDKFAGADSLRVTPDDRSNPSVSEWNLAIRSEPNPGEYRFLRFAWKKRGGKQIGLHLAHHGAFASADQINLKETHRYHGGRSTARDYGLSLSLRDGPPDQ